MKNFQCECGNILYFENTHCLNCGRTLGYLPRRGVLSALEPVDTLQWRALHPAAEGAQYRQCNNYRLEGVCNWMVAAEDPHAFCLACRLNETIPNLTDQKNRMLWSRIEGAKRRLLYTLSQLGLPITGRAEDPKAGLRFQFLEDWDAVAAAGFPDVRDPYRQVMTGHHAGLITLNLAEADAGNREQIRERMNEFYRTLLGHFRHESGHYYWDQLVRDTVWLQDFREQFGDEREDYPAALARHYAEGPPADWQEHYVSAYASSHPWEDWAETWTHYLHMVDTLETACDHGFAIHGQPVSPPPVPPPADGGPQYASGTGVTDFDTLVNDWIRLALALNALNRSMGLTDAYPYVLSHGAIAKLHFVHQLVRAAGS
ncbi:MAG: hypothetical protein B7Z66_05005 [Chromatiales bacterium 21-64-14]|nr:MAG: hypothetical protein B7Z66_05005 [Chromatiales bacterium 21-64-14]HQU16461.1 putative zinc-binding peptidase [Gammaproteobacteria bacterium]